MKEDLNKWTCVPYSSCIKGLNRVKISTLPKWTYQFKALPIKIPARLFIGIDKLTLKLK